MLARKEAETAAIMASLSEDEVRASPWFMFRALTLQELLLTTEYLAAMERLMDAPDVDWLRAGGVDTSWEQGDGVTSVREQILFWQAAAQHSLMRASEYVANADPLEG